MKRATGILMLAAMIVVALAGVTYWIAPIGKKGIEGGKNLLWWPFELKDKADFSFGTCILFAILVLTKAAIVVALLIGYFALAIWLIDFEDGDF